MVDSIGDTGISEPTPHRPKITTHCHWLLARDISLIGNLLQKGVIKIAQSFPLTFILLFNLGAPCNLLLIIAKEPTVANTPTYSCSACLSLPSHSRQY